MLFMKEVEGAAKMINKLLQVSYAASVATSQAIATYASVRAEQVALSNMTDKQLKNLTPVAQKLAIGFAPSVASDG